jgi:hypothetical protein
VIGTCDFVDTVAYGLIKTGTMEVEEASEEGSAPEPKRGLVATVVDESVDMADMRDQQIARSRRGGDGVCGRIATRWPWRAPGGACDEETWRRRA